MLYSCIIPCYNSEKSIIEVVDLLEKYFDKSRFGDLEIILVNDYSKDNTFKKICELTHLYNNVIGIDLAKNSGQHNALLAGMSKANGDYIISLDDDLQTHPSQIGIMIDKLAEGYDVVYGCYESMMQRWYRNLGAKFNDYTVRKLIGKPKGLKASSFWITKKFIKDEIIKSHSSYTNLQGLFLRATSNITNVQIEHFSRKYGTTNYTMKKLIRLWSSCLNYSSLPIHICLFSGLIGLIFSIILFIILFTLAIIHYDFKGDFYIFLNFLLFCTSIILTFMGVIGEYICRMFMVITKEPQYVIREVVRNNTSHS